MNEDSLDAIRYSLNSLCDLKVTNNGYKISYKPMPNYKHWLYDYKVNYGGNDMKNNDVSGHDGWGISTKDWLIYRVPTTNHKGLGIKRILINAPATIVFWADGTKTVAKCGHNDTFDAEKGVFICMLKKQFNMNNVEFSKYMDYVEKKVK